MTKPITIPSDLKPGDCLYTINADGQTNLTEASNLLRWLTRRLGGGK